MEDRSLYNQITVKNIDNEDFVFKVEREQYMIRAGETRVFPKFMVRPMLKHLIDKILIKRDKEGKLLRNEQLRGELAAKIVLHEETYQRPEVPTDREIVEKMNEREPELDRILAKNKTNLKTSETNLIPEPPVDTNELKTKKVVERSTKPAIQPVSPTLPVSKEVAETFDQIEAEKEEAVEVVIPDREKMLKYAEDVLKMDLSEPKTKKAWDKMSDKQLFTELGLDKEEDLASLGF